MTGTILLIIVIVVVAIAAWMTVWILVWRTGLENKVSWQVILGSFFTLGILGIIIGIIQTSSWNSKQNPSSLKLEREKFELEKQKFEFEKQKHNKK